MDPQSPPVMQPPHVFSPPTLEMSKQSKPSRNTYNSLLVPLVSRNDLLVFRFLFKKLHLHAGLETKKFYILVFLFCQGTSL